MTANDGKTTTRFSEERDGMTAFRVLFHVRMQVSVCALATGWRNAVMPSLPVVGLGCGMLSFAVIAVTVRVEA